ncbi:MAG TPA: nuclear transport factor 2 family protein [Solirubrobacteraceae bacterium]|nr:nuclear transport factor 2 family protein [Solirubrobacteraceae bacterium]
MSQENVEIVRRIYAEVSEQKALPAEFFAPDCVTDWTDVSPDFNQLRGIDAAQKALAPYFETFDDFHVEIRDIVQADGHRLVTALRDGGRIRGSGAEVWNHYFHAWTFRGRKVIWLSSHTNRDDALRAVGLAE